VRKANGFQNVTTEELKAIMNNFICAFWPEVVLGGWLITPGSRLSTLLQMYTDNSVWFPGEIAPYPSLNMIPGKYDTQTWLYQFWDQTKKRSESTEL